MIVVDTSALMAVCLDESPAEACVAALEADRDILISAGTLAEALIVSARRSVGAVLSRLVEELGLAVVSVTPRTARLVGEAHEQWGRGVHPAALNFGDCFAYALAKERACPLLFVGNDFSQTDIERVL